LADRHRGVRRPAGLGLCFGDPAEVDGGAMCIADGTGDFGRLAQDTIPGRSFNALVPASTGIVYYRLRGGTAYESDEQQADGDDSIHQD
jgi:hypothetical protein